MTISKALLFFAAAVCQGFAPQQQSSSARRCVKQASTASSLLYGDLEAVEGGSYVIEPPPSTTPPKIVHFIGGAFVGAASQLTYRYLLERIAKSGFLVVATPYRLSFDYYSVCDAVEESFQKALASLDVDESTEVIGVGHSCGALLHALLATRPDGDRRQTTTRLALLSYNNKVAEDAVPLFESLVVPLATEVMRDDDGSPAPILRDVAQAARDAGERALEQIERQLPPPPPLFDVLPLARQGLELADQLPELLREVADGARNFEPQPSQVRQMLRTDFSARDAFIIQFETDAIDESDDLFSVLKDNRLRRSARQSSSEMSSSGGEAPTKKGPTEIPPRFKLKKFKGTHLTPLTQDITLPASTVASLAQAPQELTDPALTVFREQWLGEVDTFYQDLETWLLDDAISVSS